MSHLLKAIGEALRRSHPDHAVCVRQEYWFYTSGHIGHVYIVSMLPGLDDTNCSIHKFSSLEKLSDWVHENTNLRCREDSLSSAANAPPADPGGEAGGVF
jgi:hypothetical protein